MYPTPRAWCRAWCVHGVLTVLASLIILAFMVFCGIPIVNIVKNCWSRRRRNANELPMHSINRWNEEQRLQFRQSRIRQDRANRIREDRANNNIVIIRNNIAAQEIV